MRQVVLQAAEVLVGAVPQAAEICIRKLGQRGELDVQLRELLQSRGFPVPPEPEGHYDSWWTGLLELMSEDTNPRELLETLADSPAARSANSSKRR